MDSIRTIYRKVKWNIILRFIAFRWIFRVNLRDKIWYRGKKYTVHNGVRAGKWRIEPCEKETWVKRSECRKSITLKNLIHSYRHGVNFYKTSWLGIWIHYNELRNAPL